MQKLVEENKRTRKEDVWKIIYFVFVFNYTHKVCKTLVARHLESTSDTVSDKHTHALTHTHS